jgi:hypothetical protein
VLVVADRVAGRCGAVVADGCLRVPGEFANQIIQFGDGVDALASGLDAQILVAVDAPEVERLLYRP